MFYVKMDEPFWDGVYLDKRKFLLMNDVSDDPGFFTVDPDGHAADTVQRIKQLLGNVPKSDYLNIIYEGQCLRNDHLVVYLCARTGLFLVFDKKGKFMFSAPTIDQTPPPEVTARTSGNITYFVREPDNSINYSGTLGTDYLYILSLVSWEKTESLSVDAYSLETGSYSFSFQVPNAGNVLPVEIWRPSP